MILSITNTGYVNLILMCTKRTFDSFRSRPSCNPWPMVNPTRGMPLAISSTQHAAVDCSDFRYLVNLRGKDSGR